MTRLRIDWKTCPAELAAGLHELEAARPEAFTGAARVPNVQFILAASRGPTIRPGFTITHDDGHTIVRYTRICDAFRALGYLLGAGQAQKPAGDIRQDCQFDLLGVKLDCSRNGVPRLETLKALLRYCALLGFNCFIPYMEDVFELPGEPFFGYLRGRYTPQELKALDDYAHALGIEVFGNIQTLGHLEQVLQWPAYANLRDVPGVLLADHTPSYRLLEKMLVGVSSPFRSKRIGTGMDEAHGLGTGRYRRLIGDKAPFDILRGHMRRVCKLCKGLGLRPMTSSDMYFRLGSRTNEYYDPDSVIPPDLAADIPPEMQLIYWDYYHTDASFYEDWIERHRALGKEPVMLGGVWTWSHFWAQLPFSFAATDALMAACRARGLRETIVTLWNDDGSQCDLFSALPGLAHYAEHAYSGGGTLDGRALRRQFRGATGTDFDGFVQASGIDLLTTAADQRRMPGNASTWLLWDDPLLGLLQPQVSNRGLARHHQRLAAKLHQAAAKPGLAKRLVFPAQIARVLGIKVGLRARFCAALWANDRPALRKLLREELIPLETQVERLWKVHRAMWLETYRPFGLEVLEGRYGTLRTRLRSLADRLNDHLAGRVDSIPELETKLLRVFPEDDIYGMISHARAATASAVR